MFEFNSVISLVTAFMKNGFELFKSEILNREKQRLTLGICCPFTPYDCHIIILPSCFLCCFFFCVKCIKLITQ